MKPSDLIIGDKVSFSEHVVSIRDSLLKKLETVTLNNPLVGYYIGYTILYEGIIWRPSLPPDEPPDDINRLEISKSVVLAEVKTKPRQKPYKVMFTNLVLIDDENRLRPLHTTCHSCSYFDEASFKCILKNKKKSYVSSICKLHVSKVHI